MFYSSISFHLSSFCFIFFYHFFRSSFLLLLSPVAPPLLSLAAPPLLPACVPRLRLHHACLPPPSRSRYGPPSFSWIWARLGQRWRPGGAGGAEWHGGWVGLGSVVRVGRPRTTTTVGAVAMVPWTGASTGRKGSTVGGFHRRARGEQWLAAPDCGKAVVKSWCWEQIPAVARDTVKNSQIGRSQEPWKMDPKDPHARTPRPTRLDLPRSTPMSRANLTTPRSTRGRWGRRQHDLLNLEHLVTRVIIPPRHHHARLCAHSGTDIVDGPRQLW